MVADSVQISAVATLPDGARDFYRRLGFEETPDEKDSTHQIRLR